MLSDFAGNDSVCEQFEVIDLDDNLTRYLQTEGYDHPQDLIVDYQKMQTEFPELMQLFDNHTFEEISISMFSVLRDLAGSTDKTPYGVVLKNYNEKPIPIRLLRNNHIGKLVNVDCVVRKTSEIRQEIVLAGYSCSICDSKIPLFRTDPTMRIPPSIKCPMDKGHRKMYLEPERCLYRDVQYVTIQEVQSDHGRQPKNILLVVPYGLVDKLTPGNRCRVTGQMRVKVEKNNIATMYLECYNIIKSEEDYSDIVVTEEDILNIKDLADGADTYKDLANSINPDIWGYDIIKLALVLQMFGGVSVEDEGEVRLRGDSHILLCGDPSMAKSQLIRSIYNIVPRGVYASGKSTSAAGLTAAAVKDETDGKWTLEAGAMVLANGGMCIIDELDKMNAEDRSALHEAMESQTISVNKAGLSEKLRTKCPVLAAANPSSGKFITQQDIFSQINLPPALISRFDLIFAMLDKPDKDSDDRVARHVLSTKQNAIVGKETPKPISTEMMRKYITYAKTINPVLSLESQDYLRNIYNNLRQGQDSYITVRQLEALERLTEASARVKLRSETTLEDAKRAVSLFLESLKSVSLGDAVDVSVLYSTSSKVELRAKNSLIKLLKTGSCELRQLLDQAASDAKTENYIVSEVLFDMNSNHTITLEKSQDGNTYVRLSVMT